MDRELKHVFAIQSDIAQRVAEALKVRLVPGARHKIENRGTANLDAYNSYLKGLYYWNKSTKDGLDKSIQHFGEAIEMDPNYGLAYAWLATAYDTVGWWAYLPPKAVFPKAKAAAEKALALDSALSEAHVSLAVVKMVSELDWEGAEREFKLALELNPQNALAHGRYGWYLMYLARFDEAAAEMRKGLELDPLSLGVRSSLGRVFFYSRHYDLAIEQFRKTLEMDPNFFDALWVLGRSYARKGMYEEGIAALRKAVDLTGRAPWMVGFLGEAYALSGNIGEARKVLDELKKRSQVEHVPFGALAYLHAILAEPDRAFYWLQRVYEERSDDTMLYLKFEPLLDSLRSDPRFIALLKKVGLEK